MTRLRRWLQHHLNPVHMACRLAACGVPFRTALRVCGTIGGWLRPLLYGGVRG